MNHVLLHDAVASRWLLFKEPRRVVVARRLEEVLPALARVEEQVSAGLHAAGFVAYDAAPAFDRALHARSSPDSTLPHLWFGLYDAPGIFASLDAVPESDLSPALPGGAPPAMVEPWTPSVDRGRYSAALNRIRDYIYGGDTYQINFTFRLRASSRVLDADFFRRLVAAQGAHYAALIDTGEYTVFSASPELFFRMDGIRIESRPMKGTTSRGRTLAEDAERAAALRESAKNRAENVMIVDMIRNDLGRIADPGTVNVESLFDVTRYPTVWQMTSTVSASTRAPVSKAIEALFPCASVTGAPKPRSMAIISELEDSPRGVYCGAIGYMAPGRRAQFSVAIRTVVLDKRAGSAEYGVGGGIVWDSVADDEYEECRTKALVLTRAKPEFRLLETLLWTPEEGFFLLDRHIARLTESAAYFDFTMDAPAVRLRLRRWEESSPATPQRLRLLLDREGAVALESHPLDSTPERPTPVRVRLASGPVDPADPFLYHKTTHRTVYEAARAAAPDCDDVLLWNPAREITESSIANVVADLDGVLVTPPVTCGLLPGTFRAELLDRGEIRERVIAADDLPRCRKLYLINSVRRWREAILV